MDSDRTPLARMLDGDVTGWRPICREQRSAGQTAPSPPVVTMRELESELHARVPNHDLRMTADLLLYRCTSKAGTACFRRQRVCLLTQAGRRLRIPIRYSTGSGR